MHVQRKLLALSLVLAVAGACGGGGTTYPTQTPPQTTPPSTSNAVSVGDNFFNPSATTVSANTTVTWTWNGKNPHTVSFDDGVTSAEQSTGTYSRTFTTAGTYKYHCKVHGQSMAGTITVK